MTVSLPPQWLQWIQRALKICSRPRAATSSIRRDAFRNWWPRYYISLRISPKLPTNCWCPPPDSPPPILPSPDPAGLRGIWLIAVVFLFQWQWFPISNLNKIALLLRLLTGKVLMWVMAVWERGGKPVFSYEWFITIFHHVVDHAQDSKEVGEQVIKQGYRRAAKYALKLQMLAAESGWNESALKAAFCQGLNNNILNTCSSINAYKASPPCLLPMLPCLLNPCHSAVLAWPRSASGQHEGPEHHQSGPHFI